MKLKHKLLLTLLGISVLIYVVTLVYIGYNLKANAVSEGEKLADTFAEMRANQVRSRLNEEMGIARTMAQSLENFSSLPEEKRFLLQQQVLENTLKGNPDYLSTWLSWEIGALEPDYTVGHGRRRFTMSFLGDSIVTKDERLNLDGDDYNGTYYRIKNNKTEEVNEPYWYDDYLYRGEDVKEKVQVLGTSMCVPIVKDGVFLGLIGQDIPLTFFEPITKIDKYDNSYAFLVAQNATLVAHPDSSMKAESVNKMNLIHDPALKIPKQIREGKAISFNAIDSLTDEQVYVSITPIHIGRSKSPWAMGIVVPTKEITKTFDTILTVTIMIGLFGLGVLVYIIWRVADNVTKALDNVNTELASLASGKIDNDYEIKIGNEQELATIANWVIKLRSELNRKAEFSDRIGRGELETTFELSSEEDHLGRSLLAMQASLKDERNEDLIRRWSNEGVAKFGELLRADTENMEQWASTLISELVKYMGANQGGLFFVNDEDGEEKYLELVASYAYERKKFVKKKLNMEEGITGHAMLEKNYIYMEDVPSDYVDITSGLGKATPGFLLVVPLLTNESVFGAIEIASFKQIEPHQIEFLMKLGESVGAQINSIKINNKTRLLLEETQTHTEELRAQEEEMRQNMEELQATQEELSRKSMETSDTMASMQTYQNNIASILDGVAAGVVAVNTQGIIEDVNKTWEAYSGRAKATMEGHNIVEIIKEDIYSWQEEQRNTVVYQRPDGETVNLTAIKTSIVKSDGEKMLITFFEL